MLFSIIIPTHNRAGLAHSCAKVTLANTGVDRSAYELIHIDDGSDSTEVAALMSRFKPDIQILKKYNDGTIKTKNLGIAAARGDWIIIMDSDFQMSQNWLSITKKYVDNFPNLHAICYSNHMRKQWSGNVLENNGMRLVQMKNPLMSGAFAFSRELLNKVGYLDQVFGFYGLNDAEWTRRIAKGKMLFGYVPEIVGEHTGGLGEMGENRAKKDKSIHGNGGIFNKLIKSPRVFYNPFISEDLNKVCDEYIRKN